MAISIASRWRELSGENNWEGLLDPLDLDLRRYIIHYGERTAAVGDLFNNEKASNGFGHCLYPKDEFFSRAGLENGNIFKYDVTNFFYATSDDGNSAWFGYVAVSTDKGNVALGRRDILVAWRGTATVSEWFENLDFCLTPASELFGTSNAEVHEGFLSLYTGTSSTSPISARNQVRDAVRELVDKYKDEEISITVTGYSLGAALATLNAMDIVFNGYNKPTSNPNKSCMVTVFTYAGPRVGNKGLKEVFNTLGDHLHLLRITNARDPVHRLPPPIIGYTHLGKVLKINTSLSDYLKPRRIGRDGHHLTDSRDTVLVQVSIFDENDQEEEGRDTVLDQVPTLVENAQEEEEAEVIYPAQRGSMNDYVSAHNLDVYLHGVAGVQRDGFHLEVDHDIALVNKYLDRLKDEYKIPSRWWEKFEARKDMVQTDNGHWKFVQNA